MLRVKTKLSTMLLSVVYAVLLYGIAQSNCAPTDLGNKTTSLEVGTHPGATTMPSPIPLSTFDAKPWPLQKPSRSKHIAKSVLYKKPSAKETKNSWSSKLQSGGVGGSREGDKPHYSPTLATTGYDERKYNLKGAPPTTTTVSTKPIDTIVDNVNGPKDYTNKYTTNSSTLRHSIHRDQPPTKSILSHVNDDDDDYVDDKAGKDIDFISVVPGSTIKANETYARAASTTEGYHAKAEGAPPTTATMQTGLVENPNFNAEPIPRISAAPEIKSIFHPSGAEGEGEAGAEAPTTEHHGKSLPENASVSSPSSSPSSLSFSQHSVTVTTMPTIIPKLDVGHDGVKITKKKQLFDKHFIAATGPSSSLHPPLISKDNLWPLSKNKPNMGGGVGKKLMEVPNGYLGPIMMKEKTFSVSHHGKKPKPKPSIVEQLRDKKLVEIIAPTALMEPTMKVKSSSMVPPPPEFVSIDSTSVASTTTITTTTTEGTSALPPIPTSAATTAKVGAESETATTYFLVVTQDAMSKSNNKPSKGDEAMEAMNSREIETTLKEIYTEVINAMEGAAKKEHEKIVLEAAKAHAGSSLPPAVDDSLKVKFAVTESDRVDQNQISTGKVRDHLQSSDSGLLDRTGSLAFGRNSQMVTELASTAVTTTVGDHLQSSHTDLRPTGIQKQFTVTKGTINNTARVSVTDKAPVDNADLPLVTDSQLNGDHFRNYDHLQSLEPELITEHPLISSTITEGSDVKSSKSSKSLNSKHLSDNSAEETPPSTEGSYVELINVDHLSTSVDDLDVFPTTEHTTIVSDPSSSTNKNSKITTENTILTTEINLKIADRISTPPQAEAKTTTPKPNQTLMITDSSLPLNNSTPRPSSPIVKPTLKPEITTFFMRHNNSPNQPSTITETSYMSSPALTTLTSSTTTGTSSTPIAVVHRDSSAEADTGEGLKITDIRQASTITSTTPSPITANSLIFPQRSHTSSDLLEGSTNDHNDRSSTFSHHDSSAATTSTAFPLKVSPSTQNPTTIDQSTSTQLPLTTTSPTFATITTDSATSRQQFLKPTLNSEQTESKISDIQIEVYDSTVEPILASTNFKDNSAMYYPTLHATTKQAPRNNLSQERFTQYIVDKATDFATQDSNAVAKASGKPEPAAIEIHINVSEGFGNESEDLEFSYRQSDYRKVTSKKPGNSNFITLKPFETVALNETSNEAAEEIVVEIIDGSPNSTENSASRENLNVNPVFTFRSDDDSQVELKNVKYYPEDRPKERAKSTDDFFVPHIRQQPPGGEKPLMDRDSDTIFYISNTEVKVGESLPTTNTYDAQMKKSRLESQFFPANYEEQTKVVAPQRYEEDIILSPVQNRITDPLKLVRGPLDISYVGESVMEVEQVTVTTTISPLISTPDVIIQPAVLPEMAIGVPVIGELPPQIELKEIDFMPNFDGNKEESSIQYGGDLIDEGGAMGAGFDMDSYPLGNMGLGQKSGSDAISSQAIINHRVSHLKKDELSADIGGGSSSETADGNDLLRRSNDSVNGTVIGEKMGNATAYSVMDEPPAGDGELHFTDLHTLFTACFATLLPLICSVLMAFGLRHLYRKYQTNPFNVMGRNSSTDPLDAEKGAGGDGDVDGVETPEELRASSLAFGAVTTDSPSLEICTNSNEVKGKVSNGDGRDCNGSVANGWAAASDIDVDCIQTIIPNDVLEENATVIVNCNIEAQPMASAPPPPTPTPPPTATIPPQSTITNNVAATATAAATTPSTTGTMQCNYSGANGSITTMTLKNNHLIVETEERNDISRNARETKMHYNNGEKDGVFVVEVSRGADSKIMPGSPVDRSPEKRPFNIDAAVKIVKCDDDKPLAGHEEVQVHHPPPENVCIHDEIETNHLHQIDEVDEFEEGPRFAKHSNTGLSQSDLSSSSSVDSNKRYSYGNQELYTIEQQDYTTPSPAATKAPHPHNQSQPPQPENHNDDNGHSENGHCMQNDPPNCDSIHPADTNSDVNGHSAVETKPKITAALLKQDTIIVNEMTNGLSHQDQEDDEVTLHNSIGGLCNGVSPIIKTCNTANDYGGGGGVGDTENGFDSIISLPDPPSTEEMKQMNDVILLETNQLDSLPPPPPPGAENHHQHHNGIGDGNGGGLAEPETRENGDSHSIESTSSPLNTPTKVMKPTIILLASTTDIPHTNGNCMTGHTTTAAVVEVSGSS